MKMKYRQKRVFHGLSKHPLYGVYNDILKRCYNRNCFAYHWYGGRGVTMCDEWKNNFKAFYDWCIANGWVAGMEVDKDKIPQELGIPALHYSPQMCSIVTMRDNMNATGANVYVEYLGRTQTLAQWADEYGVNYKMFWSRLSRGFSMELALTRPKRDIRETSELNRKLILNTETGIFYLGAKEAAESANMPTNNLHCKLSGKHKNNTPFIYV